MNHSGKVVFDHDLNASISYIFNPLCSTASSDDSLAAAPEDSAHFWPAVMAFVLQVKGWVGSLSV